MRGKPAAPAKITRPNSSGALLRERLFCLMDRPAERSLLWINGPPGSGKTTLVSSYIEARRLPVLWYQIDEGDGDVATFFYYMGLAAKKAAPRTRRPMPLFTPEYQFGLATFCRRYFEDLFSRLTLPHVIVFDNFQEAPEASPLHDVICCGLSALPAGMKVVVISRRGPSKVFTRFVANSLMEVIGWDRLRLT